MSIKESEQTKYYKRELTYLRNMGMEYAKLYPKIAGRLEIGIDQSPDPHIERLIESFAFLTARIQQQIDSELPQLSTALLENLYPQLVNPIPSMVIAGFKLNRIEAKLNSVFPISKHTPLLAQSHEGSAYRFRTCYPVELFPVQVTWAGFQSVEEYNIFGNSANFSRILRIRINCFADDLSKIDIDSLRFYLNSSHMISGSLYELLFCNVKKIAVLSANNEKPVYLPEASILPVGFGHDEEILPYADNIHHGYRLLQEYFAYPGKYHFFDLANLSGKISGQYFDIIMGLDKAPDRGVMVDKNTFCLGCTPAVNLFNKTTDPIRVHEKHYEYRISLDKRRNKKDEIYKIVSVSANIDSKNIKKRVEPLFSSRDSNPKNASGIYWQARRQIMGGEKFFGTQMFLSFVNINLNTRIPPFTTVYAHTLCFNPDLSKNFPAGAVLKLEQPSLVDKIFTLTRATDPRFPDMQGAALWKLISHLSLNYLSLSEGENSLNALKEILNLYICMDEKEGENHIAGITKMECRRIVAHTGNDAWRGFCKGYEITLTFDENFYVGSGAFLFASVLNRFFALYSSINSFTKLKIKSQQRDGVWKTWEPMAGEQIIL